MTDVDKNKYTVNEDIEDKENRVFYAELFNTLLKDIDTIDNDTQIDRDLDVKIKLEEGLNNRSKEYDKILEHYEIYIKETLQNKNINKQNLFDVSLLLLVGTIIWTLVILGFNSVEGTVDKLSVILPLMTTFLTVLITIPKLITDYLFNKDEEKYMTELLSKLLDHDISLKSAIDNKTSNPTES